MDEADLRAIAGADDLSHMCAVVLAALADREKGREVLNFNTVDVVLDRDEGTVLVQDVLDSDAASLRASGDASKFVGGSGPGGGVAEVEAAGGVEGVFGGSGG